MTSVLGSCLCKSLDFPLSASVCLTQRRSSQISLSARGTGCTSVRTERLKRTLTKYQRVPLGQYRAVVDIIFTVHLQTATVICCPDYGIALEAFITGT